MKLETFIIRILRKVADGMCVMKAFDQISEKLQTEFDAMSEPIPETTPPVNAGSFLESLVRSNRAIKAGRAESMADSTKIVYRRRVEDLVAKIKKLKRTLIDALDLSGDSALSLKLAQNYDENEWVQNDITTRMEIRNTTIQLVAAYQGYSELFGPAAQLLDGLDISHVNALD